MGRRDCEFILVGLVIPADDMVVFPNVLMSMSCTHVKQLYFPASPNFSQAPFVVSPVAPKEPVE